MTRQEMVMPRPSSPSCGVAQMTTPNQRARMSQPPAVTSTPEFVAAQLPERLRGGYADQRGDDGPHRGKPPRCDRLLRGGERGHDPQSRRCGVSTISESEAMAPELSGERSTTGSSWTSRTTTCGGASGGAQHHPDHDPGAPRSLERIDEMLGWQAQGESGSKKESIAAW